MERWARAMGDRLAPFLCDVGEELDKHLQSNKRVLFEGAQGALLDVDHGSYPYVTSSNCVAAQAAIGSGIGSKWLNEVLLVTKAYCTRVGEGPFFSEASHEEQEIFRKLGNEFGATTGRPRRCGWLDLPALKYAARINGATGIVLTKVDILSGFRSLKVGMSYATSDRDDLSFLEAMHAHLQGEQISLRYKEFENIGEIGEKISTMDDLPTGLRDLCACIEENLSLPVRIISYGSKRGQEFFREHFA
jgi:adenylosuccinate synthase